MADITQTGPQTYRQLQEENKEAQLHTNANAWGNSKLAYFPQGPFASLSDVIREGYVKSPFQQQAEAQGRSDYWGNSMFDNLHLTAADLEDPGNIQDIRAENQPWYAQLGAGVAKGFLTAGTTFMDGTLGLVYGIGSSIANGQLSKLFDNDVSNSLREFNRQMEYWLPNYRTRQEEEEPWWQHLNMNFWADSFIKNLGFTVGAFYSGNAWLQGLRAFGLMRSAMGAQLLGSLLSAFNEGRIEAGHTLDDAYALQSAQINDAHDRRVREIIAKYTDDNGNVIDRQSMLAEMQTQASLRDAMLQQAKANLDRAGLVDLLGNTVLLTFDNNFMFGRLFARGFETSARATERAGLSGWGKVKAQWKAANDAATNDLGARVGKEGGKYVWDNITKKKALLNGLEITALEGNEEMAQEFLSQMSGQWYSPDSPDAYYQSMIDGRSDFETQDFLTAATKGLAASYGDASQWEQFAVGALTGALGMPTFGKLSNSDHNTYLGKGKWIGISGGIIGEFRNASDVNRRGNEAVNVMNNFLASFKDGQRRFAQSDFFTSVMNGYVADGDKFEYENAKDNDLAVAFARFLDTGREQDFRDIVNQDFENMSDEDLEKIAHYMDNAAGQWRNVDGTYMSDTKEGREEMRERLAKKRDTILKQLDDYKKAVLEVRAITNNSLPQDQEDQMAWNRWKLTQYGSRASDLINENKDDIDKADAAIDGLETSADELMSKLFGEDSSWSDEGKFKRKKQKGQNEGKGKGKGKGETLGGRRKGKRRVSKEPVVSEPVEQSRSAEPVEPVAPAEPTQTPEGEKASKRAQTPEEQRQATKENALYTVAVTDKGPQVVLASRDTNPEDILTYNELRWFIRNAKALGSYLKALKKFGNNMGLLSAFITSPQTNPEVMLALRSYIDPESPISRILSKTLGQNYQSFSKFTGELLDIARLGNAYNNFMARYNEFAQDPSSINKHREKQDKKETKKRKKEEEKKNEETVAGASVMDNARQASQGNPAVKAVKDSDAVKPEVKLKAVAAKDLENFHRRTLDKLKSNDRIDYDVKNAAILALFDRFDKAQTPEEYMDMKAIRDHVMNVEGLDESQADLAMAVIQNTRAQVQEEMAQLADTADKIEDKQTESDKEVEKEDKKKEESSSTDPVLGQNPSDGGATEENAQKILDGEKPDETDEDREGKRPEGSELVETPPVTQEDVDDEVLTTTEQENNATADVDKKTYWKSGTTEYGRRHTGDGKWVTTGVPYHELVGKDHPKYGLYKAVHKWLSDNGAFDRVKNGEVHAGQEVRFAIPRSLAKEAGRPVIIILGRYDRTDEKGDTKTEWLPIGDLYTDADEVQGTYAGLTDFYKQAANGFVKSTDEDEMYMIPGASSKVADMYVGTPLYTMDYGTLNEISGGQPFTLGVIYNGKLVTKTEKGKPKETTEYRGSGGKEGQPYLLIRTADKGRMYHVPVVTNAFDGTTSTTIDGIIKDMFDYLLGNNPNKLSNKDIDRWRREMTKLLAANIYVVKYPNGGIKLRIGILRGKDAKTGKYKRQWITLHEGSVNEHTYDEVMAKLSSAEVPYQVSMQHINGKFVDMFGVDHGDYNNLIGELMQTNLPVGGMFTINNFFTVNPIVAGEEHEAGKIKEKEIEKPKEASKAPVVASDGTFTFADGRAGIMTVYDEGIDFIDSKYEQVKLTNEEKAYIWARWAGLIPATGRVEKTMHFVTPFNSVYHFYPHSMEFRAPDPGIAEMTPTPVTSMTLTKSESSDTVTYSVYDANHNSNVVVDLSADKKIASTIPGGKAIVTSIEFVGIEPENPDEATEETLCVTYCHYDKDGMFCSKVAWYKKGTEEEVPASICEILDHSNISLEGYTRQKRKVEEHVQTQEEKDNAEYQARVKAAEGRYGGKQMVTALHRAMIALREKNYFELANQIVRFEYNALVSNTATDAEWEELNTYRKALADAGYEIVPMMFKPYNEGMRLTADFVGDKSLPEGVQIIRGIRKPQVNRNGKMVQAAEIIVVQGMQNSNEENARLREQLRQKVMEIDEKIKKGGEKTPQDRLLIAAWNQLVAKERYAAQGAQLRAQSQEQQGDVQQTGRFDAKMDTRYDVSGLSMDESGNVHGVISATMRAKDGSINEIYITDAVEGVFGVKDEDRIFRIVPDIIHIHVENGQPTSVDLECTLTGMKRVNGKNEQVETKKTVSFSSIDDMWNIDIDTESLRKPIMAAIENFRNNHEQPVAQPSADTEERAFTRKENITIGSKAMDNGISVLRFNDRSMLFTSVGIRLAADDKVLKALKSLNVDTGDVTAVTIERVGVGPGVGIGGEGFRAFSYAITVEHGNGERESLQRVGNLNEGDPFAEMTGIDIAKEADDFAAAASKADDSARKGTPIDVSPNNDGKTAQTLIDDFTALDRNTTEKYKYILEAVADDDDLMKALYNKCKKRGMKSFLGAIARKAPQSMAKEDIAAIVSESIGTKHLERDEELEREGEWNEKKEIRNLARMLPGLSKEDRVVIVNALIKIRSEGGREAYGRFRNGIITIYKHAVTGTLYHEAFHYVVEALLTDAEIVSVFRAAREKFGDKAVEELEELLAEDFRRFMISEADGIKGRIRRFWRRIKNFVNRFNDKTSNLDILYNAIARGSLASRKEITRKKVESFEEKFERLASELNAILAVAPKDMAGRLLAPNGNQSVLSRDAYALSRSSIFMDWEKKISKITGTMAIRTNNGDAAVLYLSPDSYDTFTSHPRTKYDKAFFVCGRYNVEGDIVRMDGAFDVMPTNPVNAIASSKTRTGDGRFSKGKYLTAQDIRNYHAWKTEYDNLTGAQKAFADKLDRHEWEAMPTDMRELALYCAY